VWADVEGAVGRGGEDRWDSSAVEDAFALRVQLALVRVHRALDPRLRPFVDRARHALHAVEEEDELDAALEELRPILDAVASWPGVEAPAAPDGDGDERTCGDLALRSAAAFCGLRALVRGADDDRGLRYARAAVELAARGGLVSRPPPAIRRRRAAASGEGAGR
jgi:hypothetical protein